MGGNTLGLWKMPSIHRGRGQRINSLVPPFPKVLSLLTGLLGDDLGHATSIIELALREQGDGAARSPRAPQPALLCPQSLDEALKYCNYVFTIVFVFEAALKLVAFGFRRFFKDRCVVSEAGQVGATGGLGQAAGGREKALFPAG